MILYGGFPKKGDPNIDPKILLSFLWGPPQFWENPHVGVSGPKQGCAKEQQPSSSRLQRVKKLLRVYWVAVKELKQRYHNMDM